MLLGIVNGNGDRIAPVDAKSGLRALVLESRVQDWSSK
jgi:hypothetical protein